MLAALLVELRGWSITAMSIAMSVLLFGAFELLDQQGVSPVAGQTWVYVALLAAYGGYELRPDRR
ncbi:MAG: hypothetical protein ACR2K2_03795 [Mycobacteriales bacterium]